MHRLTSLVALAPLFLAAPAAAQMGLEPGAPQAGNLPGGVSPGVASQSKDDWRFDFHGYFNMPFWVGLGERENPEEGQSATTWHAPPVVPGERGSFAYTNVMPGPWTQLNFSYGTSTVRGTVIIAAETASSASGYFNPPDHIGIQDAFLTLDLPSGEKSKYLVHAGVFAGRYGNMGEFDEGQYATPLMARVEGAGITGAGRWQLGPKLQLLGELAVVGDIDKPVVGTVPEGWNDFASENIGSTYGYHGHLGVAYDELVHFGAHGFHTFAKDDQAAVQQQEDASLTIFGADLRLTMRSWGHLYAGLSYADATTVRSLGSVVRYLDTRDGPDMIRNYLGEESNGTGQIMTVGMQYDFSLASIMHGDGKFSGNAPDLRGSAFFMYASTSVDADVDPNPPANRYGICNEACMKFGMEAAYKPLSFFAVGARFDQVNQNMLDAERSMTIISPRVIFSSDWNAQDQLTLQYSHYGYGSEVAVRNPGYDPRDMTYTEGDEHVFSVTASMWW